jgi:signal transduction histidine kinase
MRRPSFRSLSAQFIGYMLLALAISQAIGVLMSWDERGQALRAAAKGEFFSRTASLARLLEATPAPIHEDILRASDTSYTRFWLSPDEPASDVGAWQREARAQLARPLPSLTPQRPGRPAVPGERPGDEMASIGAVAATPARTWVTVSSSAWPLSRPARFSYLDEDNGMGLSVRLNGGAWLNAAFAKALPNAFWTSQSAMSLALTAAVFSVIGVLVARGIARPMRRLAVAAEALGRGESIAPLPECGPDDIRQTAEAFNRMQERLQRFVADRTRMLAAIGHDLRTPLTTLRLRAEFVSEPELQEKMLKTIHEIETMTEATLAFAREDATAEETRAIDLCALVESLCEDLAELGGDVVFTEGAAVVYRCRPEALRRAIRNLVENAIRYGERARVSLRQAAETVDILVEDDGPGIPEDAVEQVFAPFHRLEHSRNRETGGVGLGLSIARAMARRHGGDVLLANSGSGLVATISLPRLA